MQLNVSVTQDDLGALIPHPRGEGTASITINHNASPKSAIISFYGINQAAVTFDDLGSRAITWSMLNPMGCSVTQRSVENLIDHLNNNMLG